MANEKWNKCKGCKYENGGGESACDECQPQYGETKFNLEEFVAQLPTYRQKKYRLLINALDNINR